MEKILFSQSYVRNKMSLNPVVYFMQLDQNKQQKLEF